MTKSWLLPTVDERAGQAPPLYLRETFPYTLPPLTRFEADAVPLDPAPAIWITDTTFRDGQQSRVPYTPEQIADLFELLARLGGPRGMIRQSEFFLYTDRDRRAVELCLEKGLRFPEITGWIRATLDDYRLVRAAGLAETGILASISDYHIYRKMGSDRATVLEGYLRVVEAALTDGVVPRVHLEDSTRADVHGVVVPFVRRLMDLGREAGIQVKVRYPDTLGVGVPHPNAALPRGIPRLTAALRHEAGVAPEALEFHGQNDLDAIVPNAVSAWLYGAAANNGTLLGIGERSGNTPIEALVFWLISLTGETHGVETRVISEIADYYRRIGEPVDVRLPFLGENFNVTRAGVHADGLIKDEEIYNPFDTTRLLNRPPRVAITDKSGAAGILMWIRDHRPDLAAGLTKQDPRVRRLNERVIEEFSAGRVTSLGDDEVGCLVDEAFSGPGAIVPA
ncbi:MAG TPA: 2-isopropylmalate synthase [Candidatus Dormibacteraeota bacterium]|nr:2-isopropylmalate synthase [Candidatus Dormibacteraeota bacterium]